MKNIVLAACVLGLAGGFSACGAKRAKKKSAGVRTAAPRSSGMTAAERKRYQDAFATEVQMCEYLDGGTASQCAREVREMYRCRGMTDAQCGHVIQRKSKR